MVLIQPLERRQLLAGNVAVDVVNDDLVITGDGSDNAIEINADLLDTTSLTITGVSDTTINGLGEPAFVSGFFGHVIIRMAGGDDQVRISRADVPQDLQIDLGAGDDLLAADRVTVRENLTINGRAGDDRILIADTRVFAESNIACGAGDDIAILAGGRFREAVRVTGGAGDDVLDTAAASFNVRPIIQGGLGQDRVNSPRAKGFNFNFNQGRLNWRSGFSDWREADADEHEFIAEIRRLPSELNLNRKGYFLSGDNRTDDLLMYLTRTLTREQGLRPGQQFMVEFDIRFASNALTAGFGVGGSPGDSVYLKAGAAPEAPRNTLDEEGIFRLNLDHSQQGSGGRDISLVSSITNGLTSEDVEDPENPPYKSVRRIHVHPNPVTVGTDGKLHLVVGTDSGFEATTSIFFQSINVRLVPVPG